MKKITLNTSKLQLQKEKISGLNNGNTDFGFAGLNENSDNWTKHSATIAQKFTKNGCDVPTIGHNDGSNCLSKSDWGICWCHGR